jgi:hypothetical protein
VSQLSDPGLNELGLEQDILLNLSKAKLNTPESLTPLTQAQLLKLGFSREQCQTLFSRLDFYFDRHHDSALLCPMLPENCDFIDLSYLGLDAAISAILKNQGYNYFNQLAFAERTELEPLLNSHALLELETAFMAFIDAYRTDKIQLKEAEPPSPTRE